MIEKIYDIAKLFYCEGGREYEMLSEIPDRGNGFFIKVNLDESTYQGLEAIEPKKFGKKLLFVTVLGNISVFLNLLHKKGYLCIFIIMMDIM